MFPKVARIPVQFNFWRLQIWETRGSLEHVRAISVSDCQIVFEAYSFVLRRNQLEFEELTTIRKTIKRRGETGLFFYSYEIILIEIIMKSNLNWSRISRDESSW